MKKSLLSLLAMMMVVMGANAQDTYSIIGEWTNWATDWDMTQSADNENIYVAVKEDITITAGTYQYKMRSNHNWDGFQIPQYGNQTYTCAESGVYTLTFTADISNSTLTLDAQRTGDIDPSQLAEITMVELRGGWNEWANDGTAAMTKGEGYTWTSVVDLTDVDQNAYKDGFTQFKLVANGKWFGYGQLTLDAPAWVTALGEGENFALKAHESGFNTFTFTATWEPSPSAATGWTLKIEGKDAKPFVFDYEKITITPADRSKVSELQEFVIDLGGRDYTITVKEDADVTCGDLSGALEVDGQKVKVSLEDKITAPGNYELNIPAGAITVNGLALDPLLFRYTIEDPEQADKDFYDKVYIDPAEGDVESLEDFRLYFPVAALANSDVSKVSLTNITTGTTYELGGFDMNNYLRLWTMKEVTEVGEYEMVVGEGAVEFYVDGKAQVNKELHYYWTIGNVEKKYYIMGSFLDSYTWETELEMTQQNDSILTLEYEYTVTFGDYQTEKTIEYKMRQGHNWNGYQLPANGNQSYTFTEEGTYKLLFTANIKSHELTLDATLVEYDYTVAGAFLPNIEGAEQEAAFFGTMWDVQNTDNDMVKDENGIYTKTFRRVTLMPGTIYYKVVANHSWDMNWGFNGNDADYVVNEAGVYDVIFKFSPGKYINEPYYDQHVTCVVTEPQTIIGDVNNDGQVGIGDIVAITNVMAGIETDEAIKAAANVNGDSEVGIGDIVAITNIMAGITAEQGAEIPE